MIKFNCGKLGWKKLGMSTLLKSLRNGIEQKLIMVEDNYCPWDGK